MPSYLKHCFAYFSLFPKAHLFTCDEIGNLWVVHGLVQPQDGSDNLEKIAREYINELRSISFLWDFEDLGHICFFRLHNLVHDLALYVAKEEFAVVNSHIQDIPEQARHLSIVENNSLGYALFPKSRSVRTILFPIEGVGVDSETLLDTSMSRCKYLRYLNLSDSSFETVPHSIAKLEHLRTLDLSNNSKIKRLPASLCELKNLIFLSLRGCTRLETLPEGLGKLINLQQLFITTKQYIMPEDEFASLIHLRTLGFHFCGNLKFLFSRAQLGSLETLFVHSCGSLESLPLYIFPKLQTLFLANCRMLNLSLNNGSPIQRWRMKHLHLADFPLLTLPGWIECAADTLETLVIENFPNLNMLPECLTKMSHLKRLHICDCPQLFSLPSDMHCLDTLEDLHINGCPELCLKCQRQSGEYWPMIAHVKSISIREEE